MARLWVKVLQLSIMAVFVAACSSAVQQPGTTATAQLANGWNSFAPGADTSCSDGSPYRFFVRPGAADKLLVYLDGGGACWTRESCDPTMSPSYTQAIADDFEPRAFGIFNFDNRDNPFADYTVVMAPYCTGDVHLGQQDTIYPPVKEGQEPLTIQHRGRTNMQAVLDWTYKNVAAPASVFVAGSSAGAIPSPFYSAIIANHYPLAKVAQLGDGAGGYRNINNTTRPDEQWGTFNFLNTEAGFEQVAEESFNYEALYIAAAKAHPDIVFAQYDTAEDSVQKQFLTMAGIRDISLLDSLQANQRDIAQQADNFRSLIAGGSTHTILRRPEFYAYGAQTVAVRDWVADLANFNDVASFTCEQCAETTYAGAPLPAGLAALWRSWEHPEQAIEPFKIFDNVYYVGIDWVAAYLIDTGEGLILIDSLYGSWLQPLIGNIIKLGFNPADVKYVINTHGHFDHAGGSKYFQSVYGAKIVMSAEDWVLSEQQPALPMFYMPVPARDIVAADGDVISLGNTAVTLFKTPGHTEGVLSLRYQVSDGDNRYTAMTLGGVGLNFAGVERTERYIRSYERLQSMQQGVSVSLPNHAAMGNVLQRAQLLAKRTPGAAHPFVDADAYAARLATSLDNARAKLVKEKAGNATSALDELQKVIKN